jgi:hypothetical protein
LGRARRPRVCRIESASLAEGRGGRSLEALSVVVESEVNATACDSQAPPLPWGCVRTPSTTISANLRRRHQHFLILHCCLTCSFQGGHEFGLWNQRFIAVVGIAIPGVWVDI